MGNTGKLAKVEQLAALGEKKKHALVTNARKAIALIKSKKDEIARDFYDIGRALMSTAQAARLMQVVKSFSERDAKKLTAAKATAIIDLAGAIGGKTTPKGLLSRGTVHVPDSRHPRRRRRGDRSRSALRSREDTTQERARRRTRDR